MWRRAVLAVNVYFAGALTPHSPLGFSVEITFTDFDPRTVTGVQARLYPATGGAYVDLGACSFNATSTVLTFHHHWQDGEISAAVARYELVAVISTATETFSWPCKSVNVHDAVAEGA